MGEALLVRKGGGAKVTIDGVKVKDDLNLLTEFIDLHLKNIPYNFYGGRAVVLKGEIHILGGTGGYTNHYKWNGTTWTSVSTLPFGIGQGSGNALVLNDEIHLLGNYTKHYKWNGTTWTSVSTLPYSFYGGIAEALKGEIHILGGGERVNDDSKYLTRHYKWNGTTWTSVSTLPYALRSNDRISYSSGDVTVSNDEIHILGGGVSDNSTNHYKWNGTTWISVSTLPYAFINGVAETLDDEIHILGGTGGSTNHYKWNGTTWVKISDLPYPFSSGGDAVAIEGQMHTLGGGTTSTGTVSNTLVFVNWHIELRKLFYKIA